MIQDYFSQPPKESFNRTRANLNPSRLPFPVKYCNFEELREYLGNELLQHHNKARTDGIIKRRFLYGHPEFKPSFWSNRWPWPTVQRLSKKYSGPGDAVDMFRLIVRRLLQESGINPDEHFDQNCDKTMLESRKKAAEKIPQTQQSWLDQSSSEDALTPPQQSSPLWKSRVRKVEKIIFLNKALEMRVTTELVRAWGGMKGNVIKS